MTKLTELEEALNSILITKSRVIQLNYIAIQASLAVILYFTKTEDQTVRITVAAFSVLVLLAQLSEILLNEKLQKTLKD